MAEPAVQTPANSTDVSWASSAAREALEWKVVQWRGDMKNAIDHAKKPEVSPALANFCYFNMALDGAGAFLPKNMVGPAIARMGGPVWLLNAAAKAFETEYKQHLQAVNDKLSDRYIREGAKFHNYINRVADEFFNEGHAGRTLWNHLEGLLKREATLAALGRDSDWSEGRRRAAIAEDFAKDVVRAAGIFPGRTELNKWAREGFVKMLERVQQVYLNSPLHNRGLSDAGRAVPGHVYVVDDHGVRTFPDLGEATRVCLSRTYTHWRVVLDLLGIQDTCNRGARGRKITSKNDFRLLLTNGWLFKIETETEMRRQGTSPLPTPVKHIAVVPVAGATRGVTANVVKTRDALDTGYRKALQKWNRKG